MYKFFYTTLYKICLKIMSLFKNTYKKGLIAEQIAKYYLQSKGLKYLSSRYKLPYAEIDLIMRHKNQLIAIEVKYRNTKKKYILRELISTKKIKKISNALTNYAQQNQFEHISMRIDAILISKNNLEWIKNID